MQTKQNNTIIYLPSGINASERWEAVEYALRQIGITDIRPAPMPAQTFQPKPAHPVLLSSVEI
jgi:hypothetical protein